ncbi:hypothetical protein [[Limnothrix rosea] IAM M-220]|uniref:hypothetical protein n=1 Tax=[Limnothrix rosea] IAM M-220 TaxID=454133 RepID=UPI0009630124|nr:hypothetical protein [[Limnothrix rosea] IAM M-220]OKH17880.1 hypothetical protein NIES208_07740 [[Limnothrix rosea] IAM M-220]
MNIEREVDWQKLAAVPELEAFFETDFESFQQLIQECMATLSQLPESSLDKIAKLRALEVTNGITQWAFRRGAEQALSVEQTRVCMNLVMGFMKRVELEFPSIGKVEFAPEEKDYVQRVRGLYLDGFKNNSETAVREFHANSAAQFIMCGRQRLEAAMALVEKDYGEMFSEFFIQRGQKYIRSYLEALSPSDPA